MSFGVVYYKLQHSQSYSFTPSHLLDSVSLPIPSKPNWSNPKWQESTSGFALMGRALGSERSLQMTPSNLTPHFLTAGIIASSNEILRFLQVKMLQCLTSKLGADTQSRKTKPSIRSSQHNAWGE